MAGALFGLMCHIADWRPEDTLRFAVDLASRKVQVNGFAELLAADVLDGQGLMTLPGW
jgi:ketohexokinase